MREGKPLYVVVSAINLRVKHNLHKTSIVHSRRQQKTTELIIPNGRFNVTQMQSPTQREL